MRSLLEYLVKSIVQKPKEVKVEEKKEEEVVNLTLSVAKEDMGVVIGKQGKIIQALRTVLRIPAVAQNLKVNLQLQENFKDRRDLSVPKK